MKAKGPEHSMVAKAGPRLFLFVGLLLLFVVACDGDSGGPPTNPADASLDAGDADAALGTEGGTMTAACEQEGAFRCKPEQGEMLEICDPSTRAGWVEFLRCGSEQLCDAQAGRCLMCEPDAYRCDGWRLRRCNESGTRWVFVDECQTEDHCSSTQARCLDCLAGQGACTAERLTTCNDNQDGFETTNCESADLCNVASMGCRQCFPGEYQCAGEDLVRCNDGQMWEVLDQCETEFVCAQTLERLTDDPDAAPACVEPTCASGEYRCNPDDPARLEGCPPSRDRFELIDVCGHPSLCDADLGECRTGCGVPGAHRCNGGTIQRCDADGVEWVTEQVCNDEGECNAEKRDCVACEAGEWQCNDNLLQRCTEDQRWETHQACTSASLCNVDPGRTDQECGAGCGTPGTFRCSERQLEECSSDGTTWEVRETCASEGLCNSAEGRCTPVGCPTAGLLTCSGQELRRCHDELTVWETMTTCAAGTSCDIESAGCIEACPVVGYRCNGAQPERCVQGDEGPVWEAVAAPCASFGLCAADAEGASCREPVCGGSLPDFRCDGLDVEECNAERTGYDPVRTCPANTSCDVGTGGEGPTQCDVCPANAFSCAASGALQRCSANGQTLQTVQMCRDRDHCVAGSDGSSGHCLVCDAGETRCSGGNLETCSDDRRSWVILEACDPANGCSGNASSGAYCNACPTPGERRCNGANQLRTCSDDRKQWVESTSCQDGCQEAEPQDYCRDCAPNSAQCMGDQRRMCSALGRWGNYTECPGSGTCIDDGNADFCSNCVPDTFVCDGTMGRRECASDGEYDDPVACPSASPYCMDGDCVECLPGQPAQCPGGEGSQDRRVCNASGEWEPSICPSMAPVCLNGGCVDCVPGRERCTSSMSSTSGREVCSAAGTWVAATCTGSQSVCLAGECVACDPDTAADRCRSSAQRETCSDDGDWDVVSCGGSTPVCVEGACQECDPQRDTARCTAGEGSAGREVCSGGDWEVANCGGTEPVCTDDGQCVCREGDTRCGSSTSRQRCVNERWVDEPCGAGYCAGSGECVECTTDAQCPAELPECNAGECECEDDSQRCLNGAHQVCNDGAWQAQACGGSTPVCDAASGSCVCENGAERCADGVRQTCVSRQWVNDMGNPACTACSGSAQCSGTTPICDGAFCVACSTNDCPTELVCASSGACVECTPGSAGNCPETAPVCSTDNECVQCTPENDAACTGATPACDDDTNTCVGCTGSGDCPAATPVCDVVSGSCAVCLADGDCDDGVCDEARRVCVECMAAGDCSGTQVCDTESNECVACMTSADCSAASPVCNTTTNTCTTCTDGAVCPNGQVCVVDTCTACVDPVADAGPGVACPGGLTCSAAGVCVP